MIFDKIENIGNYKIEKSAVDFIRTLSRNINLGKVNISDNVWVNIEEYTTKHHEKCRLEAHRIYTDIQILLDGIEELDYTNIEGLNITEKYDKERDIMFFACPERILNKVVLKEGYFALLTPSEAHQPQMAYKGNPSKVKKVVVKIRQ